MRSTRSAGQVLVQEGCANGEAADSPEVTEFTVHQVAQRTGLSEHTLRYYERAGLLQPIKRQNSSGHRRYSDADVARIATLACLRSTGMPLDQMRRYFDLSSRGRTAAPELKDLLQTQRGVLEERLQQMRWHLEYVDRKIAYWGAVESGDDQGALAIARELNGRIREYGRRETDETESVARR